MTKRRRLPWRERDGTATLRDARAERDALRGGFIAGFAAGISRVNSRGRVCFSVRTSAYRSPRVLTRRSAAAGSKCSPSPSFLLRARASSSHVTGTDTKGRGRDPRNEYTAIVVLWAAFW